MAKKLGGRIRSYRELQEMTREELAEQTDLSLDFITTLEEENVSPSLGPLLKIARVFGVRLGTFMDDEFGSDLSLVRDGDHSQDVRLRNSSSGDSGLRFHPLGTGKTDRHMEPFIVELAPSEEPGEQAFSSHEGEEFFIVKEGQVEFIYGKDRYELAPGDSVYFNSIVPHHVAAMDQAPAVLYAVLYFPD